MKHHQRIAAGLFACALAVAATASATFARGLEDKEVTLKGCLVKGEGDGSGYLLTNATGEPDWQRSDDARIQPGAVGTSGGYESVFYWLDDDNDLKTNIGHQVEIKGDLKGDLQDGEIRMDRKDNWTELTVKADGRTMKANVPNASIFPASKDDNDRKVRVLVRKVDVGKVTMLSASCADLR
jgi:hypothetical protein